MKTQLTRIAILTAGAAALAALSLLASQIHMAMAQEPRPTAAPTAAPIAPHPSTQEPAHRMTFEQGVAMEQSLSNWRRGGAEDDRGTLHRGTRGKPKEGRPRASDV